MRTLELRGENLDFFRCKAPEVLNSGPVGTGKSLTALTKLDIVATKYPGCRLAIVRKTRASLTQTALVTFEEKVLHPGHPALKGANRENRSSYRYPNGSEIVVAGMDKPGKIMSSEYDLIYPQEAIEFTEADWEAMSTRLRNFVVPYQQLIGDTNPDNPFHWLKVRCDKGKTVLCESRMEDNPFLHGGEDWTPAGRDYLARLDHLTGARRERLLYGRWVQAEGARFPQISNAHRFRMAEKWPYGLPEGAYLIMGVDYGLAAPFCALWIACIGGDFYVFREVYQTGVTADLQPGLIRAKTGGNEKVHQVYCDSSMWAKEQANFGPTERAVIDPYLAEFGRDPRFGGVLPGYKGDRRHPLGTLDALLNRNNGHPDLFIEESCTNLWTELHAAVWDKLGKEDIDKSCADHAITALYYALHTYINPPERLDAIPTIDQFRRAIAEERQRKADAAFRRPHPARL